MQQPSLPKDTLRLLSYCPLCKETGHDVEASIIGSEGNMCVWHVRTRSCGHALIAMVLKNRELVSAVGLATDLSAEDVLRVMDQKPVSIDDVLRAHQSFGDSAYLERLLA